MLTLENISFDVKDDKGEKEIIKNLSLTIDEGKFVVITGPNGGGKSTTAKLIMGIENPTEGRIYFEGQDITNMSITERANLGISFAFQQPVRFKGLTVRQLIEIAAGNNMKTDRLCDILSSVGLCANEYLNREVNDTLSGGEIKRIEIATVIARHTKLTVFDEPEAGIDLWSFANLIQVFQRLRETLSGTLIIISHQERILRIADEIMLLDGGRIRASGPADEMLGNVLKADSAMRACHKQEAVFDE